MIWQEMNNIFSKEELIGSLTKRHWEDKFFCTIWNIKWVKFPHGCILHSKSFPTSTHMPKSELKRRSYDSDKLEKKNKLLSRNCRDQASCHDQETWSRPKKLCRDQKNYRGHLAVSRPKMLEKTKKGRKLIFLPIFKPISLYDHIYTLFLGKKGSGKIGEPLSWGFSL